MEWGLSRKVTSRIGRIVYRRAQARNAFPQRDDVQRTHPLTADQVASTVRRRRPSAIVRGRRHHRRLIRDVGCAVSAGLGQALHRASHRACWSSRRAGEASGRDDSLGRARQRRAGSCSSPVGMTDATCRRTLARAAGSRCSSPTSSPSARERLVPVDSGGRGPGGQSAAADGDPRRSFGRSCCRCSRAGGRWAPRARRRERFSDPVRLGACVTDLLRAGPRARVPRTSARRARRSCTRCSTIVDRLPDRRAVRADGLDRRFTRMRTSTGSPPARRCGCFSRRQ